MDTAADGASRAGALKVRRNSAATTDTRSRLSLAGAVWMIGPVLVAVAAAVACSGVWFLRLVRAGLCESGDVPAVKLAGPYPCRVADWPEVRLDAVVIDPDGNDRVLVIARWAAHPELRALLVLDVEEPPHRALRLLFQWRDTDAPVSARAAGERLVLCRRRSDDAVSARVVRETTCVGRR